MSSLLWPHFAPSPPTTSELTPKSSSHVSSQATTEAKARLPPESISHCCPYTSICSAFWVMLLRGDRGMGAPSRGHDPLSLSHAYIPVVPVQADQAHLGQSRVEDTGSIAWGSERTE